jgi:hypothetical protein
LASFPKNPYDSSGSAFTAHGLPSTNSNALPTGGHAKRKHEDLDKRFIVHLRFSI